MVRICNTQYDMSVSENSTTITEYFDKYSFTLSDFQKYAIEGIVTGNHVLVTAHTGSGKTLPAEFAIEYFHNKGKKVIYTSPIKALSNQKFYEFSKQYPHISFGILTGDLKTNPDADVLIMTTEILQNQLYSRLHKNQNTSTDSLFPTVTSTSFNMDIDNELGAVIFDEVHYINDSDRGKVWEETIMMLPPQVQMTMLSATIDRADKFARWCETVSDCKTTGKQVYLCPTTTRVVPLHHYYYTNMTQSIYKTIKDKELQASLRKQLGVLQPMRNPEKNFHEDSYLATKNTLQLFDKHNLRASSNFVLNELVKHLHENEMLPALCFVFSRKNVETYAQQIQVPLLEDDSKVPYIARKECELMLRKLPNYQEYLCLPEYETMVRLLEKGIAIHHSGILPVLREIVEMLFAKGYIKLLFATETFAVGINMPTKTVIFTSMMKYTNGGNRFLLSHEYTQMAGRAGRRNLDTIGHVIHCNNMFGFPSMEDYKRILAGVPQTLKSRFQIGYHLILRLLKMENYNFKDFISQSMMQEDIDNAVNSQEKILSELQEKLSTMKSNYHIKTQPIVLDEIKDLKETIPYLQNKKRKQAERRLENIQQLHGKELERDLLQIGKQDIINHEIKKATRDFQHASSYVTEQCMKVFTILEKNGFIVKQEQEDSDTNESHESHESHESQYVLTSKGSLALCVQETHCLALVDFIESGAFDTLTVYEIIALLSIFANIRVKEDFRSLQPQYANNCALYQTTKTLTDNITKYYDEEIRAYIHTPVEIETIQYDIMQESQQWSSARNEVECLQITRNLKEKGIFLGEFIKALLKINTIAAELETLSETLGKVDLVAKFHIIPEKTLKFVATNQSLYV